MEIRILVGQFFALDLCPDHERVHRATYPLLLQAPLGRAAWMAHLHSCGNRRDSLLILQRRTGSEPRHVLQSLLRRSAQHSRYLETDLQFSIFNFLNLSKSFDLLLLDSRQIFQCSIFLIDFQFSILHFWSFIYFLVSRSSLNYQYFSNHRFSISAIIFESLSNPNYNFKFEFFY